MADKRKGVVHGYIKIKGEKSWIYAIYSMTVERIYGK